MGSIEPDPKNIKVEVHLQKSSLYFRQGIRSALFEIGAENVQQAKKFIYNPPKTGRLYKDYKRGGFHQASKGGESPAHWYGGLQRNMGYVVRGSYEVEFYSNVYYANWLEEGTKKMQPRPYIIRTVNKMKYKNQRTMEDCVGIRINKV